MISTTIAVDALVQCKKPDGAKQTTTILRAYHNCFRFRPRSHVTLPTRITQGSGRHRSL